MFCSNCTLVINFNFVSTLQTLHPQKFVFASALLIDLDNSQNEIGGGGGAGHCKFPENRPRNPSPLKQMKYLICLTVFFFSTSLSLINNNEHYANVLSTSFRLFPVPDQNSTSQPDIKTNKRYLTAKQLKKNLIYNNKVKNVFFLNLSSQDVLQKLFNIEVITGNFLDQ